MPRRLITVPHHVHAGSLPCQRACIQDKVDSQDLACDPQTSSSPKDAPESSSDEEGIMFTALRQGFVKAQQQTEREFQMSTSAVEIYNERVVDLLNNRQELQIRHRRDRGFYLQDVRRTVCTDVAHATKILKRALLYRFRVPRAGCNSQLE